MFGLKRFANPPCPTFWHSYNTLPLIWSYWWTLGSLYCNETKQRGPDKETRRMVTLIPPIKHALNMLFFFLSHFECSERSSWTNSCQWPVLWICNKSSFCSGVKTNIPKQMGRNKSRSFGSVAFFVKLFQNIKNISRRNKTQGDLFNKMFGI